jgi:hypothetical protein
MVKPVAKLNPIRAAVLGALIEGKDTTRSQKTLLVSVTDAGKRVETLVETQVPAGFALRYPLARNVSDHNVNVLARRWAQ